MVEDGAADKDQEVRQLEDRVREVGERLKTPPDAAEDLLKLLTEVEECLLKVEQSPAESTSIAIQPATDALVKKELLGHVDPDVRLAVASCISEITRITAPNAPYEDDEMKDVFTVFWSSRTYYSPEHSEAVRSCMETIMKLVIEESEDVQPQIASCLLENVRKEDKESSSPSFVLAEKVIGMCREKLKPVFLPLLKDTSLSEYSQIVTSVCEEGSDDKEDDKEDNNADPVKDTVDDGKLSERTISDELPQEPDKIEQDVSRPEQDGTSMNGTPGNALSSDAAPADNGAESIAEEPKKPSPPLTDQTKLDPSDKSEVILAETKKEGPTSSVEAANGAADETSGPAAVTPVKRRGRPPGQKSLEKKAAGKNQPSSDVKKIEEATDSGKLKKQLLKQGKPKALIQAYWVQGSKFGGQMIKRSTKVLLSHMMLLLKAQGMHPISSVAYDDGDVEVLLLRNEKWEFISEGKEAPVASDTPRGRKRKGSSVQPAKEEKPETPKSDGGEVPKKRGRPKGSGNGTPSNKSYTTPSSKGKAESKDVKETPKTATNMKKELEKSSKDKATLSADEKDGLPKDGDKSGSKSKEAGSKGKDSKDEIKSTEGKGRPGRKPKRASTPVESDTDKEKQEKESKTAEIEQEASANASTGKKRRRKA
ncbi:hypothetical protein PR202_ga01968 [Eleusine coracana subsp. coracana]|uniref:Uncharacterized protein n=1 Tax=Eleusine coracana subsp. coracana TaxID=191504 RepID=A0AAV5BLK9_ELECO|nr:hypothetical protein PR202_ga01281 [Eleusine coracana subsp. coracana]GJM86139.1 hypothetical protein PR202_ga01968 [Eleusine coracana subsp. coracana]